MTWNNDNPVVVGDATRLSHAERVFDNLAHLYDYLASCTLTDHGLLIGSGTGAITPLAAPTNGQLAIGSTGADPSVAAIAEAQIIDITNGAGSISVSMKDYGCRAKISSPHNNIPEDEETLVEFDAEDYDPQNEYNLSTHRYTASTAGKYLISSVIKWVLMATESYAVAIIKVSGTEVARNAMHTNKAGTAYNEINFIINLDAEDYVELYVLTDDDGDPDIFEDSFISIQRIL